eukprot:CAMPEP_0113553344 /NCGR_PEP_ID=MMETSP0015_2-20120614/15561_1 /TAXON_ID=2838 /ORGANISM="Odontella" /LENGTH=241 /DNA_ID=CAMNT_0000454403 /DNA_START=13 /DNA_END=738 /DNA_ORIENTATION=- /assembly_acc=CAM_ASM_000160
MSTSRVASLLMAAAVAASLPLDALATDGSCGSGIDCGAGIFHESLPYAPAALEPHISSETFSYHHGKHYAKYVNVANSMVEGTNLAGRSSEDVLLSAHESGSAGLFNNAAQAYNHAFFFKCMKPGGGGEPSGRVAEIIEKSFGSYAKFREDFAAAAVTAFGSGWAWLSLDPVEGKLVVTKTIGAGNPLTDGLKPLLTLDVWEHAYYIDYRNDRPGFVNVFLDNLVNWDFVNANLEALVADK